MGLGGAHTLSGASGPLPFPCSSSLIKSCAITSTWKDAFSVFPQPFLYVIMQVSATTSRGRCSPILKTGKLRLFTVR